MAAATVVVGMLTIMPAPRPHVTGSRAVVLSLPGRVKRTNVALVAVTLRREPIAARLWAKASAAPAASLDASRAAAWSAVGDLLGPRPTITEVSGGLIAAGLRDGDQVITVAGRVVGSQPAGAAPPSARTTAVRVWRDDHVEELTVDGGALAGAIAGSALLPLRGAPLPFAVGRVHGDSGGLALAIATLDELTGGDLPGGELLAATGAITPDGWLLSVRAYGRKAAAAHSAGARRIVVPVADAQKAQRLAPAGMTVVGATTLRHAVRLLCEQGGTGPLC